MGILVTLQYRTCWSQNVRGDAKSWLVIELLIDVVLPNSMADCNLVWEFE